MLKEDLAFEIDSSIKIRYISGSWEYENSSPSFVIFFPLNSLFVHATVPLKLENSLSNFSSDLIAGSCKTFKTKTKSTKGIQNTIEYQLYLNFKRF